MHVLVLGGSGAMGSATVRDLVKSPLVARVSILDLRPPRPKIAGHPKIDIIAADANDVAALRQAMQGTAAVVNCIGPFFRTGPHVARCAIEHAVNYVDISDDFDATELMLDPDLDAAARAHGVTVLFGMGSDPGSANLMAAYGARQLDVLEEVEFLWVLSIADCEGKAVWAHILHMNDGHVPQYLDGQFVTVRAGSGSEQVEFLPPFGTCEVHFVGHPEPLTFPRYFPGVRRVVNKGGLLPQWVNDALRVQADWGFAGSEPIGVSGARVAPIDLAVELRSLRPPPGDTGDLTSAARVVVRGRKDGRQAVLSYDIAGKMAPGTGIPASIAVQMLARGEITARGVFPPEGCVDPVLFLREFSARGAEVIETQTFTATLCRD